MRVAGPAVLIAMAAAAMMSCAQVGPQQPKRHEATVHNETGAATRASPVGARDASASVRGESVADAAPVAKEAPMSPGAPAPAATVAASKEPIAISPNSQLVVGKSTTANAGKSDLPSVPTVSSTTGAKSAGEELTSSSLANSRSRGIVIGNLTGQLGGLSGGGAKLRSGGSAGAVGNIKGGANARAGNEAAAAGTAAGGQRAGEAAIARPAPVETAVSEPEPAAAPTFAAAAAYHVPSPMTVGEADTVRLWLDKRATADALLARLKGRVGGAAGVTRGEEVPATPRMRATLSGAAFDIKPLFDEVQSVYENKDTRWEWEVVPKEEGTHDLHVHLMMVLPGTEDSLDSRDWKVEVMAKPLTSWQQFKAWLKEIQEVDAMIKGIFGIGIAGVIAWLWARARRRAAPAPS